jgi:hypothetical protein
MKKICFLFLKVLISIVAFAQNNTDTISDVSSNEDDTFNKMLEYSRPGKYHKVLEILAGTRTYKGGYPDPNGVVEKYYYGTFVWKTFADGHYFTADVTSSKIQMPVRDRKMKEVNYKAIYTIGYNNVKSKFEITTIANVLGSNIAFSEGAYDSIANAITFDSEDNPAPGIKSKIRDVFTFMDKDHYTIDLILNRMKSMSKSTLSNARGIRGNKYLLKEV